MGRWPGLVLLLQGCCGSMVWTPDSACDITLVKFLNLQYDAHCDAHVYCSEELGFDTDNINCGYRPIYGEEPIPALCIDPDAARECILQQEAETVCSAEFGPYGVRPEVCDEATYVCDHPLSAL